MRRTAAVFADESGKLVAERLARRVFIKQCAVGKRRSEKRSVFETVSVVENIRRVRHDKTAVAQIFPGDKFDRVGVGFFVARRDAKIAVVGENGKIAKGEGNRKRVFILGKADADELLLFDRAFIFRQALVGVLRKNDAGLFFHASRKIGRCRRDGKRAVRRAHQNIIACAAVRDHGDADGKFGRSDI